MNNYESYYNKAYRVVRIKWIAAILAAGFLVAIQIVERILFLGYGRKEQKQEYFSYGKSLEILQKYAKYKKEYPILEISNSNELDLSVIVPCYNVEPYIEECIKSIINQITKYKFEVLLIDDGSTDETAKIIKKYTNYFKVRLFEKENRGIGAARNTGLRQAKGKYVMFVDSDDILLPNTIEQLLKESKDGYYDIVGGNYQYLFENGKTCDVRYLSNKDYRINLEKTRDFILKIDGVTCTKIYKREIWNQILVPENIHFEDTVLRMTVFRKAKNYRHISFTGYQYRKRNRSITYEVKKDYRSLHAVYIVAYLIELNKLIGLKEDEAFYKIVLVQLGKFCYPRIKDLDEKIQLAVLNVSKGILFNLKECRPKKLPFELRILEQSILKEDLKTWKRISTFM